MARAWAALLIVVVAAFGSDASADVAGQASVIDGDTIEIHETRIRLHAIDAPEAGQVCMVDGAQWRGGQWLHWPLMPGSLAGRSRAVSVTLIDVDASSLSAAQVVRT